MSGSSDRHLEAYLAVKDRIVELASTAEAESGGLLSAVVPACPEWSVRDLLGHLVGLTEDWVQGNLDGYGSNQWAQAQVDRWTGRDRKSTRLNSSHTVISNAVFCLKKKSYIF